MTRKKKISTVVRSGNYLEQLKNLAIDTADQIEKYKDEPAIDVKLRKELRETLREIDRISGTEDTDDEIAEILSARRADGKPDTVR